MRKFLIAICVVLTCLLLSSNAGQALPSVAAATRPATSTPVFVDISADLALVQAINQMRAANQVSPLLFNQRLQLLAVARAYLVLAGIDLGTHPLPADYFANYSYSWQEYSAWANTTQKDTVAQALARLQVFNGGLNDPNMVDIGAAYICVGNRCAVVVIVGRVP